MQTGDRRGDEQPNKALHWSAISLRFIAASVFSRYMK